MNKYGHWLASLNTIQSLPITLCSVKVWNTCKEKRNTDITIQRLSTSTMLTMTLVTASLPTTVSTGQLSYALTLQFIHCHIDYKVFTVGIIQCQSHCDHLLILNNSVSCSVQGDCYHSYNVKWSTRKMKPSAVDKVHIAYSFGKRYSIQHFHHHKHLSAHTLTVMWHYIGPASNLKFGTLIPSHCNGNRCLGLRI